MPLAANALITLAEAKEFIPIDASAGATYDALVESLIGAKSTLLENRCNRAFIKRTFVERHRRASGIGKSSGFGGFGWGSDKRRKDKIYLSRPDVVSITSIVDPAGNSVPSTDYVLYGDDGIIRHVFTWPIPVDENHNVAEWIITYVAGKYTAVADVEQHVKLACKMLVALRFGRSDPSVGSIRIGDLSVTQKDTEGFGEVPQEVLDLIEAEVFQTV